VSAAPPRPSDKILTRDQLLARHGRPRTGRVVFTNGCFDLLHPGHVQYLDEARRLGDVLVVGVNTDRSVSALKGASRPLVPQNARAAVLAGLASVDAVVLFDEDTPRELIAAIGPDVLVKGADWALDDIVGRAEVEARGGRVERVDVVPGVSTTELIRRIRSA
jgi:D-beta-D-heptose 7-phosphate kinase/D-beta-D-heptose 1-phosphate adenosyltransferase